MAKANTKSRRLARFFPLQITFKPKTKKKMLEELARKRKEKRDINLSMFVRDGKKGWTK